MRSDVVLGLGGGIDYELTLSAPVLDALVEEYRIGADELDRRAEIRTERDLVISILDHLRHGEGGEHFVVDPEVITTFAARMPRRITLGGSSVRAGLVLSRSGIDPTLHLVTVNDHLRRLLPANCHYVCSGTEDSSYPHLIAQYERGLRVRVGERELTAARANRLIYVNDPPNEEMVLRDDLGDLLSRARVFMFAGLNGIRRSDLLQDRLATLRRALSRLPPEALVYYEDAGFHVEEFKPIVQRALLDRIDVFGLNEDELQSYLGRRVDLLSADHMLTALRQVRTIVPARTLVVHTAHWAAAVGERAADWRAALDAGVTHAGARYAYGDDCTDDQLDRVRRGLRQPQAVTFAEGLERRWGPGLVCRPAARLDVEHPTTIGLGDTFVGGFLSAVVPVGADVGGGL
ncbi:ADP-dependent glucokinase/phosphofructokinase [Microlunatus soli]|uniref:ADP-dependent phosphofructokinase/glucokinase n=1 Tax=Microlunatus soli TaxID=630515 RepID=A0A1H1YD72_9ACTN|nr:ADP-dependent glucokinase/phosphofructokinase [Microlunatus soli]SDT19229.1 ADP-dependent phosphofructokinase/glucokinase [Microlunatus soli]